eukprot:TRINITY_DN2092_c0_g1_i1.p1 TRINITY_DN2092_c0_g1~~TRINITY_DN2092_c0_g1_i1.p1  ORF type:complete len:1278 (+),score=206.32 TRINITY_DN2092_c0_g1_i1:109-3942(+)
MSTPSFTAPPPMNRFLRRSQFRTAAITMSSQSSESSVTRLQSLQRTIANRGKSLRARGIRGKADEAAEKERKFREDIGLDDVSGNIEAQGINGLERNNALALKSPVTRVENVTAQLNAQSQRTAGQAAPKPASPLQERAVARLKVSAKGELLPENGDLRAVKRKNSGQKPSLTTRKNLETNLAVKTKNPAVQSTSVTRSTSNDATLAEDVENSMKNFTGMTLNRRSGSLPWKHSSNPDRGKEVDKPVLIPMLDSFTKDPGFTRLDGSLPWIKRSPGANTGKKSDSQKSALKADTISSVKQSIPASGGNYRTQSPSAKDYGPIDPSAIHRTFVKVRSEMDKFKVLSTRYAHFINDKGVSPSDILVITLSNKNSNTIKELLGGQLDGETAAAANQQVRTFHSICVQLLRRYGDRNGIPTDFDICGGSDSASMLSPIIQEITGASARSKDMKRYKDLVAKLKQDVDGECRRTWLPVTFEQVEKIRIAYDEALREVNQLDFVDIVMNTCRVLHENADVVQELGKLYKHVLIDDWNGANSVHVNIVSALAGKNNHLFVTSNSELSAFHPEEGAKNENEEISILNIQDAENHSAESILENLNPSQLDAVIADPNRACLVMAGPGSGKTRVLTHRFAYLVKAHNISPSQILAVTFTNKAANEMKERIEKLVGQGIGSQSLLSIGTFHSICLRLLRLYGNRIDIPSGFNVCDASDSRSLLTRIMKKSSGGTPSSRTVGIQRDMISKLKNDSDGVLRNIWQPFVLKRTEELRSEYDKELRRMNLLDFDDLLLETRRLLVQDKEVWKELSDHYHQVLVDEWQDTNTVQFEIVSLLAEKRKNLFVVGDIDQSIYKFRGADVKNVRRFYHKFKKALEVSLDQNYRSTEHIVNAAHAVIVKNREGKRNAMTTENGIGRKVQLRGVLTTKNEADFVAQKIRYLLNRSEIQSFSDISVLYRTNAQSRAFEEAFISYAMPYRLHSGVRFFERQEVKDILSYLKVAANVDDDLAFRRIVNTPARGIGKKTIEEIEGFADTHGCSIADSVVLIFEKLNAGELELESIGLRPSSVKKLGEFYNILYELRKSARTLSTNHQRLSDGESGADHAVNNVGDLVSKIIDSVGYEEYVRQKSANEVPSVDKISERLENIAELQRYAGEFSNVNDFLDNVALVSESDRNVSASNEQGRISMMTLHGGKGLEFPVVFIVGAEDNMIPIGRAVTDEDVEEERRLFYVGMTRAKKLLFISWRKVERSIKRGKVTAMAELKRSRFVDDIPDTFADTVYDYEDFASE